MGIYQYIVLPICGKMKYKIKLVLCLLCIIKLDVCAGYRILGIFPINAQSHMMMFEQLMKGLALRGHQVDVVSTFRQKIPIPNYSDIILPTVLPKVVNNKSYADLERSTDNNKMVYSVTTRFGNFNCEKGLHDPQLQKIINNPPDNPPYDLVIVEIFAAHCFMAFGHHLNVPVIGISSSTLYPWGNDMIGNPENLAFSTNNLWGYADKLTFSYRIYNVLHTFYYKYYFNYYTSQQTDIIKKHFGKNTPNIRELEKNLALILTNSHPSLQGAKPHTPALIEVGGLHVQDDGPEISKEDKKWLDESTDGFVYFTFGSMVMIESFPLSSIHAFYKSFEKISPIRIFMKAPHYEKLPPGLPDNVRTFSWTSQIKVLKHKNIRGFITHGGLMGSQEAITYAVPMIGIPLFAEQFANINIFVEKKIAIRLNYQDITEEKMDFALKEILNNPMYKNNVKKLSIKFLDRPLSALDTACYWVEYIGRHGNDALRSPSLNYTWWQIQLLDVYFAILIAIILFIIIFIIIIKYIITKIFNNHKYFNCKKNK